MPELRTYLEYNDPNIIIWRKGTPDDPYKPRADSLPVINGIITLLEIPSETERVQISGFTEISQEMYKKKAFLDTHEFLVNYSNGVIQFNSVHEGKSFLCNYYGRGIILYPASRIYAMVKRNPDVVVTLQDYIDGLKKYTENLDLKLIEINNAIQEAIYATESANKATDNANLAAQAANEAAQQAIDAALRTIMIPKEPVLYFEDIATTYPEPENGWRVMVLSTGDIYRYDGVVKHDWEYIENYTGGVIPFVSEESDGLLYKEDYRNFIIRSIVFQFPRILVTGVQDALVKFPLDGEIVRAYAFCSQPGVVSPLELSVEKISSQDYDEDGVWDNIFATNIFIQPYSVKGTDPIIQDIEVKKDDYFRVNIHQLDNNIRGVTVQLDINIKNKNQENGGN